MLKILFVCTGNTCRSPMAAGIFRKIAQQGGTLDKFYCMSAGLAAQPGAPATANAVAVCREIGVDISRHRARRIADLGGIDAFDVFVPMTSTQAYVLQQAGVAPEKLYHLGEIPDPYGQNEQVYRQCRDSISQALNTFYQEVVTHYGAGK